MSCRQLPTHHRDPDIQDLSDKHDKLESRWKRRNNSLLRKLALWEELTTVNDKLQVLKVFAKVTRAKDTRKVRCNASQAHAIREIASLDSYCVILHKPTTIR